MTFQPLTPEQYSAARQKFSPEQIIQFEQKRKTESAPVTSSATPPQSALGKVGSFLSSAYGAFQNASTEFLNSGSNALIKAGANTIDALSTPGKFIEKNVFGLPTAPNINSPEFQKTVDAALPKSNSLAGMAGTATGTILPYVLPSMGAAKVEAGIDAATSEWGPVTGAIARILGKSTVEGVTTGVTAGVTTNNANTGTAVGLTTAAFSGTLNSFLEVSKGLGIPEYFMSKVFKDTKSSINAQWTSAAAQKLQESDPQLFADYVKKGIYTVGADGEIAVNTSLAQKMLEQGMAGSVDNMGTYTIGKLKDLENQVQTIAQSSDAEIIIPDSENLQSTLLDMSKQYQGVTDGKISQQALNFAAKLKSGEPLSAEDTLGLRRLLDGARRFTASGEVPSTLSLSQKSLEYWSNIVRKQVNTIPGMGPVMGDYTTYLDGLQSLLSVAKKAGNDSLVSQLETALEGFGVFTGNAPAVGTGLTVKALGNPRVLTNAAQFMVSPTTAGGVTTRAAMSTVPFSGQK